MLLIIIVEVIQGKINLWFFVNISERGENLHPRCAAAQNAF
jgi:hypothetical protein